MHKIFFDPGHGGSDSGAVANGLVERDINLVVALAAKEYVERTGQVQVMMSRTKNSDYVDLSTRAEMANKWHAELFVSFHENAGGGDRGEVYHSICGGRGITLSQNIADEMKVIGQTQVLLKTRVGDYNKDYYAVIRETFMDAVIVEGCFLDNIIDCQFIDTIPEQKALGVAIAKGILKTLGVPLPANPNTPPINPIPKPLPNSRRNVVIYRGDVDKIIAQVLSWELDDCIIKTESEYVPGCGRSIYIIGAACNNRNIAAHVRIQGKDRKETLLKSMKRAGYPI